MSGIEEYVTPITNNNGERYSDVINDTTPKGFEVEKDLLSKFKQIVVELKSMNIPNSVIVKIVKK